MPTGIEETLVAVVKTTEAAAAAKGAEVAAEPAIAISGETVAEKGLEVVKNHRRTF